MLNAESRIKALEDKMDNILRVGIVSSIDPVAGTARVAFKDRSNLLSYDLPVLVRNTVENKDYWMPDIDEQVLCVFLPIGLEAGFVIGGFYSKNVKPPASTENKQAIEFKDGTRIEYDREEHKLQIDVPEDSGEVVINCAGSVTVNSPKIDLGEASDLQPSVLGDNMAAAMAELISQINASQVIGNLGAPSSAIQAVNPVEVLDLLKNGNVYSEKNRNQ